MLMQWRGRYHALIGQSVTTSRSGEQPKTYGNSQTSERVLMPGLGHKPRRRSGPGVGLCPQYLPSRRNFMHRSERRQVPRADSCTAAKTSSLDDFVGAGEQLRWHVDAERLGGLEIDDKLVLGRRLHRKVGGLLTLQ